MSHAAAVVHMLAPLPRAPSRVGSPHSTSQSHEGLKHAPLHFGLRVTPDSNKHQRIHTTHSGVWVVLNNTVGVVAKQQVPPVQRTPCHA